MAPHGWGSEDELGLNPPSLAANTPATFYFCFYPLPTAIIILASSCHPPLPCGYDWWLRCQGTQSSGTAIPRNTTPIGRFAQLTPGRVADSCMGLYNAPLHKWATGCLPLLLFSPILISLRCHPWTFICTPGSHVSQRLCVERRHKA